MTTSLAADELVTECHLPLLADDTRFGFFEVNRRAGDFAMAAALVTYRLHDGRIADPHVGLGGVEPFPRRLPWVEARLAGEMPDGECFRAAGAAAAEGVEPMQNSPIATDFRRHLVSAVTLRALQRSLP